MDDSIFTKIIKGEIPCRKVYEDDDVIAFLYIKAELNPLRVGVVVEGLDVPHAHIHLVPLYDRDTLQLHHDYPVDISDERLDDIANSIKERLIAI